MRFCVIKESSIDCIPHSKGDIHLNDRCMRFSKKILNEDSHFIGLSSNKLNELDTTQLKSKFYKHIKPNIHIVSSDDNILIYYQLDISEIDIRYIRENGKRICDYHIDNQYIYYYDNKDLESLGKLFSLYQRIYKVPPQFEGKYPSLEEIKKMDEYGLLIKNNLESNYLFYTPPLENNSIIRLYNWEDYQNKYIDDINYLIIYKSKYYKNNNMRIL